MAHIKVISHEESEGRLREIYDEIVDKRGKLAEVAMLQSLNPESIVKHMDLYMELVYGQSSLVRYKREMLAVIVSLTNKCEYCILHHGVALNHFWKDQEKIDSLADHCESPELTEQDKALCEYAKALTLDPSGMNSKEMIDNMKAAGMEDDEVLDATMIIAYFNFVNRMILGLGVAVNEEETKGYNYD